MFARSMRRMLALALAACGLAGPAAAEWQTQNQVSGKHDPLVYRYDPRTDTFVRAFDLTARPPDWKLGSEYSYYGSRLTEYQYLGPANRGGIYDALRLHQEELKLDPKRYRYHR